MSFDGDKFDLERFGNEICHRDGLYFILNAFLFTTFCQKHYGAYIKHGCLLICLIKDG